MYFREIKYRALHLNTTILPGGLDRWETKLTPNLTHLRLVTSESTMKTDINSGFTEVDGLAQGNAGSLI